VNQILSYSKKKSVVAPGQITVFSKPDACQQENQTFHFLESFVLSTLWRLEEQHTKALQKAFQPSQDIFTGINTNSTQT